MQNGELLSMRIYRQEDDSNKKLWILTMNDGIYDKDILMKERRSGYRENLEVLKDAEVIDAKGMW